MQADVTAVRADGGAKRHVPAIAEDDARRAVRAGLEIVAALRAGESSRAKPAESACFSTAATSSSVVPG